jgi:hypothetical protein
MPAYVHGLRDGSLLKSGDRLVKGEVSFPFDGRTRVTSGGTPNHDSSGL